jgi:hypothetical protein
MRLLASRYSPATSTWEFFQPVSQDGKGVDQWCPGTAAGGETFVLWAEVQDGQVEAVVASSLDVGTGTWQAPVVVGNKQQGVGSPSAVAVAKIGAHDLLALWQQDLSGEFRNLWTNRSDGGMWAPPDRPVSAAIARGNAPSLTSGPGTSATAMWLIDDSLQPGTATYDPTTNRWSSMETIAPVGAQVASPRSLAMRIDAEGARFALWAEVNSTKIEIGYNAAAPGTPWQPSHAQTISTDIPNPDRQDEDRGEPVVAIGAPGAALIVWPARAGSSTEVRAQWVTY